MTQREYLKETNTEKKKEDWMNSKWRPMMGWMYMAICLFDFMIAPILWSLVQALFHGGITTQWQPLTLQGAGLFHVAMGAVIGISAYGRTQEKLNGANNGGLIPPGQAVGTTYIPPGQGTAMVSNQPMGNMNNGMGGGFGSGMNSGGFGSPSPGGFGSPTTGGFGSPSPSINVSVNSPAPATPPATGGFGSGFNSGATPLTTTSKGHKVIPAGNEPEL